MNGDHQRVSRTLAYILRHDPGKYGLSLDDEGFVGVEELLAALRKEPGCEGLARTDLEALVAAGEKRRFELTDRGMRALYGHSAKRIAKPPEEPPERLFHGTSPRRAERIFNRGIRPMGRSYVHLSVDEETALQVGRRHAGSPLVLAIEARRAWHDGVRFYRGNEETWLTDFVPPEYITLKR